jgi:uncharacterized RDD family membrane protein YckC
MSTKLERVKAMAIDHAVMTVLGGVIMLPCLIYVEFVQATQVGGRFVSIAEFPIASYFGVIAFSVYLNKDAINGRSIGKRIVGLQVVIEKTQRPAGPMRCLIRNITFLLWPFEVVSAFFNPSRRLGDYIAGTNTTKFDQLVHDRSYSGASALFAFGVCVVFLLFCLKILNSI